MAGVWCGGNGVVEVRGWNRDAEWISEGKLEWGGGEGWLKCNGMEWSGVRWNCMVVGL